jgi:hypothetical protein
MKTKPTLLLLCLLSSAAFAETHSEAFRGALTDDRPRAEPPAAETHVAVDADLNPARVFESGLGKTLIGLGAAAATVSVAPLLWEFFGALIPWNSAPGLPLWALAACGAGYLVSLAIVGVGFLVWYHAKKALDAEAEQRDLRDTRRPDVSERVPNTIAPMTVVARF